MKSLPQALLLAMVLLLSGFASSVLAGPPAPLNGAPVVAQYSGSGNSYGSSSSSSSGVRVRSYRGLFRLGALVVILIVSGIGFLIRQMNGG
jgi:hypothetical protein